MNIELTDDGGTIDDLFVSSQDSSVGGLNKDAAVVLSSDSESSDSV